MNWSAFASERSWTRAVLRGEANRPDLDGNFDADGACPIVHDWNSFPRHLAALNLLTDLWCESHGPMPSRQAPIVVM